nr:hypothetical protein [Tanacetum cinerariifolium]
MKGIKKEFSVARTPQHNGIAKRKNMTLIEAAKTMLADSLLSIPFWADAVNTACYVQNRALVTKPHNKTPYELLLGRTPSIGFMRPFGCHVTILNTLDPLGKFDGKADEGFLVGNYVNRNGPTWLFDINTLTKSMNYQPVITGNQPNPSTGIQEHFDADKAGEGNVQQYVLFPLCSAKTKKHDDKTKREAKGKSPVELSTGVRNLSEEFKDFSDNSINEVNVASTLVPAVGQISTNSTNTFSVADMPALEDITYSDDEENVGEEADFSNLETNITVSPIPITRVYKDHHEEGIDYEEVFAPVSRIEAIRLFLDYAFFMGFMVYRMDVKSAFLYGTIEEEVYVYQPPGFEDPDYPDKVYKVVKALYGLHQAPRACQDKYVAKILRKFGLTDEKLASTPIDTKKPLLKDPNGEDVDVHTYWSMIGSLMYLTSSRPDIMFVVCECTCFEVSSKASHLHAVKRIFKYLKGKPHLVLWYPKDSPFNLVAYSDSDYAGASLNRKSTIEGCQFLGCRLISWQYKKQKVVATSSTEAEYVAANRVLVVKPHFKTPYELFRGGTPALSFIRPFGCHVTILNTLYHLGKFDGKLDEGFFDRYSKNSKAFRVYNTRTRKEEENLHIKFLENKPLIAGTNSNNFVGKGASFDIVQSSMEAGPSKDYILMPIWNNDSLFDSSPKDSDGDNQDNDGSNTESEIDIQERPNDEN